MAYVIAGSGSMTGIGARFGRNSTGATRSAGARSHPPRAGSAVCGDSNPPVGFDPIKGGANLCKDSNSRVVLEASGVGVNESGSPENEGTNGS